MLIKSGQALRLWPGSSSRRQNLSGALMQSLILQGPVTESVWLMPYLGNLGQQFSYDLERSKGKGGASSHCKYNKVVGEFK